MRKVHEEVIDRTIFNLKLSEIKSGERPGWIDRCVFHINGDNVIIRIEVHEEITVVRARYLQLKLTLIGLKKRYD